MYWNADSKIRMKSGKKSEIVRKPEEFPVKNIIISYLRSKLIILSRNMIENAEIWRFEKNPGKSEKKSKFTK